MSYIPAFRSLNSLLRARIMQDFSAEKRAPRFNQPDKIKDMVLIDFRHISLLKRFRWGKQWWTKTTWKGGTNQLSLHEQEFASNQVVGISLKDLLIEQRKWIHSTKKTATNLL